MFKFAILKIMKDVRGNDLVNLMAEFDQDQILDKLKVGVMERLPSEKTERIGFINLKREIPLGYSREDIQEALIQTFKNIVTELKDMTVRLR